MIDQVRSLTNKGIQAALICSANGQKANTQVMERLLQKHNHHSSSSLWNTNKQLPPIQLLYCTPELLKTDRFRAVLTCRTCRCRYTARQTTTSVAVAVAAIVVFSV